MTIFYGVACILSLLFLVGYFFVNKKQNKWIMCIFLSIFVCNSGYFITSISKDLTLALVGNSIAYLGNVFLPFFMFMLILDVCNIKHSKVLKYILLVILNVNQNKQVFHKVCNNKLIFINFQYIMQIV